MVYRVATTLFVSYRKDLQNLYKEQVRDRCPSKKLLETCDRQGSKLMACMMAILIREDQRMLGAKGEATVERQQRGRKPRGVVQR